jgi:hypothetical protein
VNSRWQGPTAIRAVGAAARSAGPKPASPRRVAGKHLWSPQPQQSAARKLPLARIVGVSRPARSLSAVAGGGWRAPNACRRIQGGPPASTSFRRDKQRRPTIPPPPASRRGSNARIRSPDGMARSGRGQAPMASRATLQSALPL